MTSLSDIKETIMISSPSDYIWDDDDGSYMHKEDINLRFMLDRDEGSDMPKSWNDFDEPWVHKFPNNKAKRQLVRIFYGAVPVMKIFCVYVDGARHLIPMPKSQNDLTITEFERKVGSILNYPLNGNDIRSFSFALNHAGITVQE
jgi:hypothetical protein